MKPKEITPNEEFIASGYVFSYHVENAKIKFKLIREHKGKMKGYFIPPTQAEVMEYFFEKGYESFTGITAWEYYNELGWKDKNGEQVKNWKAKMISTWFKESNKRKIVETKDNMVR